MPPLIHSFIHLQAPKERGWENKARCAHPPDPIINSDAGGKHCRSAFINTPSSSSQDYFLLLFTSLFYNLFKSPPEDMFVDFRKRGREGERERNFSLLPGAHIPTGDQTQNLGMCPEGVKPTTFLSAGDTQPTEHLPAPAPRRAPQDCFTISPRCLTTHPPRFQYLFPKGRTVLKA